MTLPPDAIPLNQNQSSGMPADAIPLNSQPTNSAPISQNPVTTSPMDYWVKNPAISAGKTIANEIGNTGNLLSPSDKGSGILGEVTHPVDTISGIVKSLPRNWGDLGNDVVSTVKGIPDMVVNHPLQTAAMALPFAEGAIKLIEPASSDALIQKAIPDYAKIINPNPSIDRNFLVEHKDINDVYGTLANNGIIIKKSESSIPGMAPKQDSSYGINQIDNLLTSERNNQQQLLQTNKSNVPGQGGFDMDDFAQKAKDNLLTHPLTKNDPTLQSHISDLMDERFYNIKNNANFGKYINASQLNNLKSGWQNIGWEIGKNNDAIMGRVLGSTARSEIKDNLNSLNPGLGDTLDQSNAKMAKLLEAKDLLQKTHGTSIPTNINNPWMAKGAAKNLSTAAGVGLGYGVGHLLPGAEGLLGEGGGAIGGYLKGGEIGKEWAKRIQESANDPETITGNWAKQIQSAKLRENPPALNQNPVMRPQQQPMAQPQAQPPVIQSPIVQPTPQQVKQFGTSNAPMPSNIQQGSLSQNPIHNMPPEALKSLEKQIKIEKIIRS